MTRDIVDHPLTTAGPQCSERTVGQAKFSQRFASARMTLRSSLSALATLANPFTAVETRGRSAAEGRLRSFRSRGIRPGTRAAILAVLLVTGCIASASFLAGASITYVQGNYSTPQAAVSTVTSSFVQAQTAGDLNVVVVGWHDTTAKVRSVTDSAGNTYAVAVGPTGVWGYLSQVIYYAKHIAPAAQGTNVVTVTFTTAAEHPDIRILEYSGADPNNPVDDTAARSANWTSSRSGAASTTNATDLIFGANIVTTSTEGPGRGFTLRLLTSPDSDIAEDQVVTKTGWYQSTAPVSPSGPWIMQMVAFRTPVASSVSSTSNITASPSSLSFGTVAVGGSSSQTVTLSNTGTASIAVSQATPAGTGFSVSGLSLPMTLAAGQSTSFSAVFAPTAAGSATGSISVVSNASNSPLSIPLAGTGGTLQVTASPTSVSFGNITVGKSATQAITLTNSGTLPVTVSQATTTGTGFSLSGLSVPMTLAAGQSSSFTASFSPTAAANETGSISIVSNASNSPLSIPLAGTGVTLQIAASPSSLNFGTVAVGSSSSQTLTLSNTGTASITVSQATPAGTGFSVSGLSVPMTLAAGQSTSFSASFAPTAAGSATGSISVMSNASNSPLSIPLAGTGGSLQVAASPASVSFGNITVGKTAAQAITLTNSGTSPVTVSQATTSGSGFSVSGPSLPLTLTAGQNTSFSVTFAPTSAGSVTGNLSVVSNASNSPLSIPLAGTGVTLQIAASPSSLSFGTVAVGSSSSQTLTLSNTGTASITVSQATPAGTGFSVSGLSVPMTLAAGQSTSFSAIFAPTAAGSATGSISVVSNASNSPLSISLAGTGGTLQVAASPTSLSFGNITIGSNSTLPVVLTNNGTASVTLSQATTSGSGFSVSGPSLPLTLSAGQNTSFSVTFAPTSAGGVTGNLSVVSNATNSPSAVSLSGTGANHHSVSLTWVASTSPSITGYNVYRSTVSGGPYTKLDSTPVTGTSYTDTTVAAGQTYYYVTTAVDSQGVESANSNQATAAIPSP